MIERSVMVIIPYVQIELLFLDKLSIQFGSSLSYAINTKSNPIIRIGIMKVRMRLIYQFHLKR